MVWPSIFETVVIPEKRSGLRQPDWIGMNVPFWRDLDALGKAIVEQKSDLDRPFRFVAATWHTDLGFEQEAKQEGKFLGPYLDATFPEVRDPAWQFLGFDITDAASQTVDTRTNAPLWPRNEISRTPESRNTRHSS